jgi:hypothetical protein
MAFTWLEKNQTKVTSNQWGEDIYGLKATNVFGLAWNYYLGYTKFITGLDMTLDMGMKAEFFYAWTYKIGYAEETNFNAAVKVSQSQNVSDFHANVSSAYGSVQRVINEALAQITTRTENVDEDNRSSSQANHDYNVLNEVINENRVTIVGGTDEQNADTVQMNTNAFSLNATGEVSVDAPIMNFGSP